MEKEFNQLLKSENKTINYDKVSVSFNDHSIDIMDILEDGSTGYGKLYYSVYEAFEFLKDNDCLE